MFNYAFFIFHEPTCPGIFLFIFTNLVQFNPDQSGSEIAPATFYNAIATEEDYLNALQHQQHHVNSATLMAPSGQIGTINTANGPMQIQLNGDTAASLVNPYGTIGGAHNGTNDLTHSTYHLVGSDGTLISVSI